MTDLTASKSLPIESALPPPLSQPGSVLLRMTAALRSAFSLPDPIELARLLGVEEGQEADEILARWISSALWEIDDARAAQLLVHLVGRLDELLQRRGAS